MHPVIRVCVPRKNKNKDSSFPICSQWEICNVRAKDKGLSALLSDKSGCSVLVALMKENPLKGLTFHAAEANTDFLLGAGTVSALSLFSFSSVFVSLPVIHPPCEILSLSISQSILWVISWVTLPCFHILYLCCGASIPVQSGQFIATGGGWKYLPDNQFSSRLRLESKCISIVDFISHLTDVSVLLSINDEHFFLFYLLVRPEPRSHVSDVTSTQEGNSA